MLFRSAVHFLDEQIHWLKVSAFDEWQISISVNGGGKSLAVLYYILKLDHLLCVPAMICLYLGLKSLLRNTANKREPSKPL